MTEPRKKDYGWHHRTKWLHGDEARYNKAMRTWKRRPRIAGKPRTKAVHPSWEPYNALFNPNDHTRSQAAFCRWCWGQGVHMLSCNLSNAKTRQIKPSLVELLEKWRDE